MALFDAMSAESFALFALTQFLACITPGPAVLFLLSTALARGLGASVWANLGVLAGNAIWIVISATGLGSVLLASPDLFMGVKWVGAAYLVWLGFSAFFGRSGTFSVQPMADPAMDGLRILRSAAVVQATNPKALIFFGALLPQFVDPARPVVPQLGLLTLTCMVIEFAVLLAYGALAAQAARWATAPRFAVITNRMTGIMLVAAAIGMATLSRG